MELKGILIFLILSALLVFAHARPSEVKEKKANVVNLFKMFAILVFEAQAYHLVSLKQGSISSCILDDVYITYETKRNLF